ncbi:MAG: hypothetical protein DWI58_03600 [Chloroflexi bacterium]|nr:MAG: hypothetical protein DWI58_03600 [Chloroflexota bacterium]
MTLLSTLRHDPHRRGARALLPLLATLALVALAPIEAGAQAVPPGTGHVPPPHIAMRVEYADRQATVEGTGDGAAIEVPAGAAVRLTLTVDSDVSIYDRPWVLIRQQDGPGIARSFTPTTTVTVDLPLEGRGDRVTLVGEMRLFVREAQGVTAATTRPLTIRFTQPSPLPRNVLGGVPAEARAGLAAVLVAAVTGGTWAAARRRGSLV